MSDIAILDDNRSKITSAVGFMKTLPQTECPVIHRFAPNCYLREIFMPAGTLVIGKIHATEHFNIIISGSAVVTHLDENGEFVRSKIGAGDTFISQAYVQKVVEIIEDCTWQTVHVTDKTDLQEIEKNVIVESYDQIEIDALIANTKVIL